MTISVHMITRRLWKIGLRAAATMLVATVAAFAVWSNSKPHWKKPEILVRFLGMTNGAYGTKMARFELSNADSRQIGVEIPGCIDIGWRSGGYFGMTNTILQPGTSLVTSVEVPATRERWRVGFLCSIPLNLVQRLKNRAADRGLPVLRTGLAVTHAYSEWLEPTGEINWNDWLQQQTFRF